MLLLFRRCFSCFRLRIGRTNALSTAAVLFRGQTALIFIQIAVKTELQSVLKESRPGTVYALKRKTPHPHGRISATISSEIGRGYTQPKIAALRTSRPWLAMHTYIASRLHPLRCRNSPLRNSPEEVCFLTLT